jgi:tetratricopeptide (TPR) repeat protein
MKKCLIIFGYLLILWQNSGSCSDADSRVHSTASVPSNALSVQNPPPSCENQTDGRDFNRLGFRYYESGDYLNAIDCYKLAISQSPDYPVPLNNLGVIYLKSNQLELAYECFTKAIALNSKYIKAICNMAVVCYKMGSISDAKQFYEMAMRIDSSYVERRIENYIKRNQ